MVTPFPSSTLFPSEPAPQRARAPRPGAVPWLAALALLQGWLGHEPARREHGPPCRALGFGYEAPRTRVGCLPDRPYVEGWDQAFALLHPCRARRRFRAGPCWPRPPPRPTARRFLLHPPPFPHPSPDHRPPHRPPPFHYPLPPPPPSPPSTPCPPAPPPPPPS